MVHLSYWNRYARRSSPCHSLSMLKFVRRGGSKPSANEVHKIRLTLSLISLPSSTCVLHRIPPSTAVPRALLVRSTEPSTIRSTSVRCVRFARCVRSALRPAGSGFLFRQLRFVAAHVANEKKACSREAPYVYGHDMTVSDSRALFNVGVCRNIIYVAQTCEIYLRLVLASFTNNLYEPAPGIDPAYNLMVQYA